IFPTLLAYTNFNAGQECRANVLSGERPSGNCDVTDNTKKKAAWDEHIHFKVESTTSNSNHELIITCWNMNIKGLDGRLGEIRQDMADFEKFDEFENKGK